jgi:hypothetical protein
MSHGGKMKHFMALAVSLVLAAGAFAAPAPQDAAPATTTKSAKKRRASHTSENKVLERLDEMQRTLASQQEQIQKLQDELQSRDSQIQQLQQQASQSQAAASQAQQKADTAASQSAQQQEAVTALRSDVTDLKANTTSTAAAVQDVQKGVHELESPLALHYKGVTITPVGFLAAETVWRQHALGSDINTPFNSIPFDGASQANISEFFGSGRQSRVGMLVEGKLKSATLRGYVEADFLSAGVTSNNNESNSYTLRQRQVWGQAALNSGWTFTGGQQWSLVTETRNGMDNRTEVLPMTIDPAYNVGFSWARQYGFRVVKNFNNKAWMGFSIENPQSTLTVHGSTDGFLLGTAGVGGGLYNLNSNYSYNAMPDIVGKLVFQPGWGHYEIFGVVSRFRDRVFPDDVPGGTSNSATGAYNNSVEGWGIGANIRESVFHKHMDLGVHFLGGDGVGRYGASTLSDLTVNPNGTLATIRSYQALGTWEFHYPKIDLYMNTGVEYAGRTLTNGTGTVGYGTYANNSGCDTETIPGSGGFSPGSLSNCTGDTRNLIEGTVGFWYRFYKGPKGTIQWGPQYSYLVRNTWSGAAGASTDGQPTATENMFLTSFRYYLP